MRTLIAALALALTFGIAPFAHAQSQCDKRDKILELLATKYTEAPVALGVTNNGGLVEVTSAPDGTTWSIIVTGPNGKTCLVVAGEGWRRLSMPILLGPET